jgi:acyl-CoA thioester hydrolase
MKIHVCEESVRYSETDQMQVAHHASYLSWFEIGRTTLLRDSGYSYRSIEENGSSLPVVEYSCRLMKSAGYDDRLRIETSIESLRSRTIVFAYRILKEGRLIVEGKTKHVCVNGENKPQRIPSRVIEALKEYVPA